MKKLSRSNFFGLGVLLGLSFLLIRITDKYILSVDFYNNSGDILSGIPGQEIYVYNALQKWIYLSEVLYELFKVIVVTLILHTALYLNDQQVKFERMLKVVIYSEYVFLIPAAFKIAWFMHEYPNGTILNWHHTYILSALSLFDSLPADWFYPLQTLNVFEVGYWFLLAYGIFRVTTLNFDRSLRVVMISYLPALIIWLAVVAFCTIIIFPSNG